MSKVKDKIEECREKVFEVEAAMAADALVDLGVTLWELQRSTGLYILSTQIEFISKNPFVKYPDPMLARLIAEEYLGLEDDLKFKLKRLKKFNKALEDKLNE